MNPLFEVVIASRHLHLVSFPSINNFLSFIGIGIHSVLFIRPRVLICKNVSKNVSIFLRVSFQFLATDK